MSRGCSGCPSPGPPPIGSILIGTVKSYSVAKGFGFMTHPDINQDIWFAKESVAAECRASELAGTNMYFELIRAPDGKAQARALRPAPAGVQPGIAVLGGGGPISPGPLGVRGGPQALPKRRAWSPHAGSRAIKQSYQEDGGVQAQPPEEAPASSSPARSSSHVTSESSEKSKKKKKKKDKKKNKKKKKKKSKSSSSEEVLSSSSSRSRSRKRSAGAAGIASGGKEPEKPKTSPEIEQAKLEALEKLKSLQGIESKEARAKEWRALLRVWHPDKNPDKKEVATAVFQFLQKGKTIINL